ncbi:MAG: sulfotransferase [Chloroflexi bacterium]|nr:sulfotransferase [Chloroflexota bacterium]
MSFLKKLFQSKQPVIVVSGLPRSGTSMMMKMLEVGGIPPLTDKIREADKDNPKGYYEFERVKKLDKGGTDWLPEAQGKVVKVISQLLKYLPTDYEYKIIFMRRNMDEILASQKKMLVRRGEDPNRVNDEELSHLFGKHLSHVMNWINENQNVSVLYIHYSEVLSDPEPQAIKVNDFLGSKLNVPAMATVVDPDLYRNRQEELAHQ